MADGSSESEKSGWMRSFAKRLGFGPQAAVVEPEPVVETPFDDLVRNFEKTDMDPQLKEKTRAVLVKLGETTRRLVADGGFIFYNGIYIEGPLTKNFDIREGAENRNSISHGLFRSLSAGLRQSLEHSGLIRFESLDDLYNRQGLDLLSCVKLNGEDKGAEEGLKNIPLVAVAANLRKPVLAEQLTVPLAAFVSKQYRQQGVRTAVDPTEAATAALTQAMIVKPSSFS